MTAPLVVGRTGTPDRMDVPCAAACLAEAFWEYPETVHLLPDRRRRRHALHHMMAADIIDSAQFGTLVAVEIDDDVVGVIAWLPPDAYPVPIARQLKSMVHMLPAAPWGWRTALEARRGQAALRSRHHAITEPHFFIRAVGVVPTRHRQGIGTQLLAPVLTRADSVRSGCYLTTASRANVAWYEGFGFEVTGHFHPTPTWPAVWEMWRQPRP